MEQPKQYNNKRRFGKLFFILVGILFCGIIFYAINAFTAKDNGTKQTHGQNGSSKETEKDETEPVSTFQKNEPSYASTPEEKQPVIHVASSEQTNQKKPENTADIQVFSKGKKSFLPLSKLHCEQNCDGFTKEKEKRYCQEYCGFSEEKIRENCELRENLEKDYCYKTIAIEKKDVSLCKDIVDALIQETCENRIMEDIVSNSAKL